MEKLHFLSDCNRLNNRTITANLKFQPWKSVSFCFKLLLFSFIDKNCIFRTSKPYRMKIKKLIFLLIVILLNGCSPIGHIEFEDIPINGNLDKFVNKLIKLGYTEPQLVEENQVKLNGVFLEKNCEIYVYATKKNKNTYKVRVNLPAEVQDSLQLSFEKIQRLYSAEYGIGKTRFKQYRNPERFMFNEPALARQLREGDFTRYITAAGYITVEVQDAYISITYLDNKNYEIRKKESEEEYNKEINSDSLVEQH